MHLGSIEDRAWKSQSRISRLAAPQGRQGQEPHNEAQKTLRNRGP